MVWCQGESDKSNWKNGNFDYFGYVKSIVDGLQDVVTVGEFPSALSLRLASTQRVLLMQLKTTW